MKKRRYLIIVTLLLTLAAGRSLLALEWDKTQIAAAPARGDEVVRAKYEFKNLTNKTVHILEVTTSCGCTEATPTSSKIAPGESGAVDVLFTIGKRAGLQEKEITVRTDDSDLPTKLTLKITIPTEAAAAPVKVATKA